MSDVHTCPRCGGSGEVVLTPAEVIEENRAASFAQNQALRAGNLDPVELQRAAQGDQQAEVSAQATTAAFEKADAGEDAPVSA